MGCCVSAAHRTFPNPTPNDDANQVCLYHFDMIRRLLLTQEEFLALWREYKALSVVPPIPDSMLSPKFRKQQRGFAVGDGSGGGASKSASSDTANPDADADAGTTPDTAAAEAGATPAAETEIERTRRLRAEVKVRKRRRANGEDVKGGGGEGSDSGSDASDSGGDGGSDGDDRGGANTPPPPPPPPNDDWKRRVVKLRAFLHKVDIKETRFSKRAFGVFDDDASGDIDFKEFVLGLWAFCTSDRVQLAEFAASLYDNDQNATMEVRELKQVLRDVYGADEAHGELFQKALRKIERVKLRGTGGDDRTIPISQFVEFARQSPSLLFPAFRVQQKLRKAFCGKRFWDRAAARRARAGVSPQEWRSTMDELRGDNDQRRQVRQLQQQFQDRQQVAMKAVMDATIVRGGGAYALLDRQVSPEHLTELTDYAERRRRNSMDPFAAVGRVKSPASNAQSRRQSAGSPTKRRARRPSATALPDAPADAQGPTNEQVEAAIRARVQQAGARSAAKRQRRASGLARLRAGGGVTPIDTAVNDDDDAFAARAAAAARRLSATPHATSPAYIQSSRTRRSSDTTHSSRRRPHTTTAAGGRRHSRAGAAAAMGAARNWGRSASTSEGHSLAGGVRRRVSGPRGSPPKAMKGGSPPKSPVKSRRRSQKRALSVAEAQAQFQPSPSPTKATRGAPRVSVDTTGRRSPARASATSPARPRAGLLSPLDHPQVRHTDIRRRKLST